MERSDVLLRNVLWRIVTALLMIVAFGVPVPILADHGSSSGHVYCSTANPLGLVYLDIATGQKRRLFYDPVWALSAGPRSWVAALRGGARIEVFRDAKPIRSQKLQGTDNELLGWTDGALLYRQGEDVRALDVANGGSRSLTHLADVVAAAPAETGWVAVSSILGKLRVEQYSGYESKPTHTWPTQLSGRLWDYVVIGGRYLVVWTRDYDTSGDYIRDRLSVFDVVDHRQWDMPFRTCEGISPGHSRDELLVGTVDLAPPWKASTVNVEVVRLPGMSQKRLAGVDVRRAELQGLSADGKCLVMYATYPNSGPGRPGKVFGVRLNDSRRRVIAENVYECVLAR